VVPIKFFLALALFSFDLPKELYAQKTQTNRTLDNKQQSIVAISSFTAKGDLNQLQKALNNGLDAGLKVNEIKEVLVHLYAYCGFPRSIRGLQTFMEVLNVRKSKGINDVMGSEASPVKDERSKYERGKGILDSLLGTPQNGPKTGYSAFAPVMDTFLKEHLFADIFERDVLTYQQRELVTVSVLASIGGVEPMLQSHLKICLNEGLTPAQLRQLVDLIKVTAGETEAKAAQSVLADVLKKHNQPNF